MNSLEALEELKIVLRTNPGTKQYSDIFENHLIMSIEHDLQILNLLARYCTFTNNTITFNATITDENEIKLLKSWFNCE